MRHFLYTITGSNVYQHVCFLLTIITVFCSYDIHAITELSGSIGGRNLSAENGPYIVVKDISVPEGESTVIGEGCRFFFKPFTGVIVKGDIIVKGTQDHPVLFSSINDSLSLQKKEQLPNPFDWNGIHITSKSKKVVLEHFILNYSVYGLKSQNNFIVVNNGNFWQNGQFHFTINEKIMPVADGIPYSYGNIVTDLSKDIDSDKHGKSRGKNLLVNKIVPAAIGAAGVGSGVVSLVFLGKWYDLRGEYSKETNPSKRDNIKNEGKQFSQIAAGTGAFSIAAIATGAVLFWNWNLREEKSAEVIPLFVPGGVGVAVSVNLR